MKTQSCFICRLGIDIEKENFCKISDYHNGKHFKSIYCHPNCWREHLSNKRMLQQAMGQAVETTKRANKMLVEAGY